MVDHLQQEAIFLSDFNNLPSCQCIRWGVVDVILDAPPPTEAKISMFHSDKTNVSALRHLRPSGSKWIQVNQSESTWIKVNPSQSKWIQVNQSESNWIKVNPSDITPGPLRNVFPESELCHLQCLGCMDFVNSIFVRGRFGGQHVLSHLPLSCLRVPNRKAALLNPACRISYNFTQN